VADLAIEKALSRENPAADLRWSSFLGGPALARTAR
jgi:hypothetical protein